MGIVQISKYKLGDMEAYYFLDDEQQVVEWMLLPEGMKEPVWEDKKQNIDPMIQLKLVGDAYASSYAGGSTMRQSESCYKMKYDRQEKTETGEKAVIRTFCKDERGYETVHNLIWIRGEKTVRSFVTFLNKSEETVTLEKLDSFDLGGITPYVEGDAHEQLYMYRVRSVWSEEGRLEVIPLEDIQLEPSWVPGHAIRCERFGGIGSLPVNKFFPYLVMEDRKTGVFWGAQIAHNASWEMEVFRRDEAVSIGGGLADRDFGHWYKRVAAGESFTTPEAILTVAGGSSIDVFSQRLTSGQVRAVENGPVCEQELPVIFNEYCTTWGNPSHDNISHIVDALKGHGLSYFVIDCGWYKEDGVPWGDSMGDYNPSATLFPDGLDKTVAKIRDAGMKPGIWFEIDNVGCKAKAYQKTDLLLKRDGEVLTTLTRRFWDMRKPEVIDYLSEKVIGLLNHYGFEYMKMDYNDTIGIGCDGAESLGEGLRQNMEASVHFIEKIKENVPGIILENCASGGHKLEPEMMGQTAMASFSDAHECEEIPVIAANLHRVILPRQSQIWAVIRESDSTQRIVYSVAAGLLGRLCLSGDVTHLTKEQWDAVDRGIAFYKKAAPIIRDGVSHLGGTKLKSWRHLEGWQSVFRETEKEALIVIHTFAGELPEKLEIDLGEDGNYTIVDRYCDLADHSAVETAKAESGKLICRSFGNWKAAAFLLKRD